MHTVFNALLLQAFTLNAYAQGVLTDVVTGEPPLFLLQVHAKLQLQGQHQRPSIFPSSESVKSDQTQQFSTERFDQLQKLYKTETPPTFLEDNVRLEDHVQLMPSDSVSAFGSSKLNSSKGILAIGVGFQKCATTLASHVIGKHPMHLNVHTPKEFHYLAPGLRSLCYQINQSAPRTFEGFIQDCAQGQYPKSGEVLSDFTPSYTSQEYVESFIETAKALDERARKNHTEVRLLVFVRDPVDRIVSAVSMQRMNDDGGIDAGHPWQLSGKDIDSLLLKHLQNGQHRELTDGQYVDSLMLLFRAFPRSQILVVNMASLANYTAWQRIHWHVGLAPPSDERVRQMSDEFDADMQRQRERKYKTIDANGPYRPSSHVLMQLRNYYAHYDARLWALLGVEPWW